MPCRHMTVAWIEVVISHVQGSAARRLLLVAERRGRVINCRTRVKTVKQEIKAPSGHLPYRRSIVEPMALTGSDKLLSIAVIR